jgi:pimeloyl-ACP methyl ester carboxylesterase
LIKAPTLYILGGKSTIVSQTTQEQLKSTIPGCEIVVMPGLGHYPHLEAPAAYVDLVAGFLEKRVHKPRVGDCRGD